MEGTLLGSGDASVGLKLIGLSLPRAYSLLGEEDLFKDCELRAFWALVGQENKLRA